MKLLSHNSLQVDTLIIPKNVPVLKIKIGLNESFAGRRPPRSPAAPRCGWSPACSAARRDTARNTPPRTAPPPPTGRPAASPALCGQTCPSDLKPNPIGHVGQIPNNFQPYTPRRLASAGDLDSFPGGGDPDRSSHDSFLRVGVGGGRNCTRRPAVCQTGVGKYSTSLFPFLVSRVDDNSGGCGITLVGPVLLRGWG